MLEHYEQKKQAVLDLADIYLKDRPETKDVGFHAMKKNLEDSKYILAVVGEVKAGKSTFINALLKEEVLPSGVLQNTKAIIEIEKPKEDENGRKYIKVVWGNKDNEGENVETIFESENKEDLNNELKKIAAVDTKYRDIPTTVIDGYLLANETEIPIEALEREGEYSSLKGKESLIKSYIEEYKDKSKIPVEIHFVYPLQYSFSDLVVVDSPGVNARGGIQRRTRESIYRANAIIFVRSLETPAEHTSFHEFYREVIPDRPKETLFLVFTKAQDKDELDLKKDEIREDIPEISEEKIIGVDSLCRLLQFELEKYKTPDELIDTYKKQKTELSEQLNKASNDTKKELREKIVVINNKLKILESIPFKENKKQYSDELKKMSNFDKMEEIIEKFSTQAPLQQLQEILESIKEGYKSQSEILKENIKLKEMKIEEPQKLEIKIKELMDALKEYEYDKGEFVRKLGYKYDGEQALYMDNIKKIKESVDNILLQDSEDKIFKECENIENMIRTVTDKVVEEISDEVLNYFNEKKVEFKEKYDITIPTVNVNTLKTAAMESAYDERPDYKPEKKTRLERKWYTLWVYRHTREYFEKVKTGTIKVFNNAKYLEKLKKELKDENWKRVKDLQEKHIRPIVNKYCKSVIRDTDNLIEERKKSLNELLEESKTNDRHIKDIKKLKKKLEDIGSDKEGEEKGKLKEVKNQISIISGKGETLK